VQGGAVAFLAKPFGDDLLLNSIQSALDVGKSPADPG
jgi:FixJ family two-component response regulator